MDSILQTFRIAYSSSNGYLLSSSITPSAPPGVPTFLYDILHSCRTVPAATHAVRSAIIFPRDILWTTPQQPGAWLEIFTAYWRVIVAVVAAHEAQNTRQAGRGEWTKVYEAWKEVVNALIKGYTSAGFEAWTVPCIYVAGRWLRIFAMRADRETGTSGIELSNGTGVEMEVEGLQTDSPPQKHLEDAARQINRLFSLCVGDRAPLAESRKWAIYGVSNLLFKTYFKLNSTSLTTNILRSLSAAPDLPPLAAFPKSHIATFKYYTGVISFLREDYTAAQTSLDEALALLPSASSPLNATSPAYAANRALVLTYLIPTRLVTDRKLPSGRLLAGLPPISQALFSPLVAAVKRGDLRGYDAALERGQDEFVKRRMYLTLERGRDVCLRNLFRRVYLAGGSEEILHETIRRSRIWVDEFAAGLRVGLGLVGLNRMELKRRIEDLGLGDQGVDRDEVECQIANLVYKGLMKGYISRERGIVVLSKAGAFPGTGV